MRVRVLLCCHHQLSVSHFTFTLTNYFMLPSMHMSKWYNIVTLLRRRRRRCCNSR
jgi:hypothetical protein